MISSILAQSPPQFADLLGLVPKAPACPAPVYLEGGESAALASRWLPLRVLGTGTLARVIEVLDLSAIGHLGPDAATLPRWALKCAHAGQSDQASALFGHEAMMIHNAIGVPGIPTKAILEAPLMAGPPALRMPLFSGPTLAELMRAKGNSGPPFSQALACTFLHDLAETLAALHQCGLCHGDVKPANLILPALSRPILIDFGSAARLGTERSQLPFQRYGLTPPWAGVGALSGLPVSTDDDVTALALLAFRLLQGHHPLSGRSLIEAARQGFGAPAMTRGPKAARALVDHVLSGGQVEVAAFIQAFKLSPRPALTWGASQ
jgi:serine/threonine-protein kinase